MERRTRGTVFLVALIGLTALAMLLPAAVGFTLSELRLARGFLYSALLLAIIAGLLHLASRGVQASGWRLSHPFHHLTLAYLILPALMAVPLTEAVPGMRFLDAWFEMVAAFTTTGASVLDGEGTTSLHLWRALVGWGGGLFILVVVMAMLSPINLGGFELFRPAHSPKPDTRSTGATNSARFDTIPADKSLARLREQLRVIGPIYFALTLALWVALSIAGNPPLHSLMLAMSAVSTSGIAPEPVLAGGVSEGLIALVLVFALTRRFWPGAAAIAGHGPLQRDPELRLGSAVMMLMFVAMGLVLLGQGGSDGPAALLAWLWAIGFTSLSFLTTTGFISGALDTEGGVFAGPAGIALLGLAMIGGGVATTAGGLKLMRVFALFWQARFEVAKLVHPQDVGGDGPRLRGLRTEGAIAAWLFLMIFIFALMAMTAVLTLGGTSLEDAIVYAVAALTTTGPLTQIAAAEPLSWAGLSDLAKVTLAFGMVLGRLELLLLLSVFWRR